MKMFIQKEGRMPSTWHSNCSKPILWKTIYYLPSLCGMQRLLKYGSCLEMLMRKKFCILKKGQILEFVNKNKIGCILKFKGDTERNEVRGMLQHVCIPCAQETKEARSWAEVATLPGAWNMGPLLMFVRIENTYFTNDSPQLWVNKSLSFPTSEKFLERDSE